MEDVRENKEWMCPHCIEEKGIKPYWICNRYLHMYHNICSYFSVVVVSKVHFCLFFLGLAHCA